MNTQESVEQNNADFDVDSLMDQVDSREGYEIPMTAEPAPVANKAAPQVEEKPTPTEFEFEARGKQIKTAISDPRVKQWLQQGYDYAQRIEEFNRQQEQFSTVQKEYDEKYKPIDEYVRQNPQFWEHVVQSWNQKEQLSNHDQIPEPMVRELQSLKSEFSKVNQFVEQQQQKEMQAQREKEELQLTNEIESIRKLYPDLDLSLVDESGKSLEYRVLEYATQHNIPSFKTAFNDFNHDRLMKLAEERGKQAVQKEIQKKTKLGLLGTTPTPKAGLSESTDYRSKSYSALADEALSELMG